MWQRQLWLVPRMLQRCAVVGARRQHPQVSSSLGLVDRHTGGVGRGMFPACIAPLTRQCRGLLPVLQQSNRQFTTMKKTKMKSYSSYKLRFRLLADGTYRRARAGKRHNASSKTKKQRRQLRRPAVVHPAYARVMKKLNFA